MPSPTHPELLLRIEVAAARLAVALATLFGVKQPGEVAASLRAAGSASPRSSKRTSQERSWRGRCSTSFGVV